MKVVESSLVPCLANIGFGGGGNSHSVASFGPCVFYENIRFKIGLCFWAM